MSTQAHQDWTPVVIRRTNNKISKKTEEEIYSRVKFETEDVKIKYVPSNVSQLIINGRNTKKLTRKQLANELNLKEDVIADIENGKAIYNGNIIARIKKYLGVK
jgi:ribosome-binding protein aMBF1 (putative translation factor)